MQKLYKALIIGAIGLLFVGGIAALCGVIIHQKKELKRVKANYEALVQGENDVQQQITKAEFKEYFSEQAALIKEYGVKAGQVQNFIEVKYVIKDSTRVKDTLVYVYDTINDTKKSDFHLEGKCWSLDGTVSDNTIEAYNYESNDKLSVALYKEKRKCLFAKRRVKAIAVSECKGDTLAILRNLKIGK